MDITEYKQAEAALRQANEELHVLSRRLFQIQEDERRRLARELHDQMGQALTAAKIDLQAAQRLEERNAIVERLDDSVATLERILQQVPANSRWSFVRRFWTTWGWCRHCAGTLTSRRSAPAFASNFSRTQP